MFRNSIKIVGMILILVAACGGEVFAQGTMQQQAACRPDVFRLCGNFIPDVGAIVACLRGNEPRLSEACREVMVSEADRQYPQSARMRTGEDR